MKKILILALFLITILFQNCTEELIEIDAVVSPEIEERIVNSDDTTIN